MADKRREFERLTRESPRAERDERAFITARIELVQNDPRLTDDERQRALLELRQRLDGTPPPDHPVSK